VLFDKYCVNIDIVSINVLYRELPMPLLRSSPSLDPLPTRLGETVYSGRDAERTNLPPAITTPGPANPRLAVVVWLCLCAIWGSTWLAIKMGLRDLPPLTFAGIRFAIAAVLLFAIIEIRGIRLPRRRAEWNLLAYTGLLSITINYALVFSGEQYISSGMAAVLSATVPLFGLPLAHRYLAREPLTGRKMVGVVLGFVGVAIVFSGQLGIGGSRALWASFGIIIAALSTAHASVLVKAKGTHIDPAVMAGVQMAGGCIPLLLCGIALEGNPFAYHWTPLAVAAMLYLAILGSVIAFLLYYWLIRHTDVTGVLLIPLVTPLVAVFFGVVFAGEIVGWHSALGGAAILGGVALAVLKVGRRGER
jgi:drug/metabolite transporter (DMT)-like permease